MPVTDAEAFGEEGKEEGNRDNADDLTFSMPTDF